MVTTNENFFAFLTFEEVSCSQRTFNITVLYWQHSSLRNNFAQGCDMYICGVTMQPCNKNYRRELQIDFASALLMAFLCRPVVHFQNAWSPQKLFWTPNLFFSYRKLDICRPGYLLAGLLFLYKSSAILRSVNSFIAKMTTSFEQEVIRVGDKLVVETIFSKS